MVPVGAVASTVKVILLVLAAAAPPGAASDNPATSVAWLMTV